MTSFHTLRLILGDQLNANHSWYKHQDAGVLYVIAELHQEATYVRHHVQKICAFFAAMEHFANALKAAGHQVCHLTLDDTSAYKNLPDLIAHLCQQHSVERFEYQQPDEYRLSLQLQTMDLPAITATCCDSEHFLLPQEEITSYIKVGKHKFVDLRFINIGGAVMEVLRITQLNKLFLLDDDEGPDLFGAAVPLPNPPDTDSGQAVRHEV